MLVHRPGLAAARGFTLVELIVFIVVVAIGLTGTLLVINRSVLLAPQALVRTRAMELAQAYLDEIVTKRYDEHTGQGGVPRCDSADPGAQACTPAIGLDCNNAIKPDQIALGPDLFGSGCETRAVFDDVDDYDGTNDSPPVDAQGNPMDNYDDYRVQVSVLYAGSELGLADNRYAKRVTVVITTPLDNTIPVSVYRTNY